MARMNTQASNNATGPLPLERSYLSLQEAFEQAISLEILLAGRKGAAVDAARVAPAPEPEANAALAPGRCRR